MALILDDAPENPGSGGLDFAGLVDRYYEGLYRFALSLSRSESHAADLTQQTFLIWAKKGHQLHDPAKVKTWLFTTLHREFLGTRRREDRFPHHELDEALEQLPPVDPDLVSRLDAQAVLALLRRLDPVFQAPVALFYLEDHPYREIAEILNLPLGTVKSRIARGIARLQALLLAPAAADTLKNPNG